jgi:hypothetical protein
VQQIEDGDARMVKAATDCQIVLLRKKDAQPDGTVKFITSVWGISDDRSVRMQQKRMFSFEGRTKRGGPSIRCC